MNTFQKRVALRIGTVSVVLALIASPIAWLVARERAEENVVALATEESGRLLHYYHAIDLTGQRAREHAVEAARIITGGLFDIAEIYSRSGEKLAESMTEEGEAVENLMPRHVKPGYAVASYESVNLPKGRWALRVFVPLRLEDSDSNAQVTGYFEGVRIIPEWQERQIFYSALTAALLAATAALLCGLAVYPVVVFLSADNERKAREVLDSHISMMESLGRAIAKRD